MTDADQDRSAELLHAETRLEIDDHRRVWKSEELLSGECEAIIVHRGQVYRLRCTKHDKLILYK